MPEDEVGDGGGGETKDGDNLCHQLRTHQRLHPLEASEQQQRGRDEGQRPADDIAGADGGPLPEVSIGSEELLVFH